MKETVLLADNSESDIIKEGRELLLKYGFPETDIAYYADRIIGVLDDYAAHFGENTKITYFINKQFGRLRVVFTIPGEKYDPFQQGEDSTRRQVEKLLELNFESNESCISYVYMMEANVITGFVPLKKKHGSFWKDPNLWGVILGTIFGLILTAIPDNIKNALMDDLLNPLYDVMLKTLSGIMGPIIFITLITSIISLNSVNKLTDLGFRIFFRCLRIIILWFALSLAVGLIFFEHLGPGAADFSMKQIIQMLLNIIPINLFQPFVENNTPQLVVLAFALGIAFLMLQSDTSSLNRTIHQINDWMLAFMKIVCKVLPIIPFLSVSILIASGQGSVMLQGLRFIIASYIVFTLALVFKLLKAKFITKIPARKILQVSKDALVTAFLTNSTTVPLPRISEISEKDLHIKPEFTSFWLPLTNSMMSLKTTVNVVLAALMMAEMQGVGFSISFLFVLLILAVEMSLASPGTIGSWVITFEALSMPTSYVGLFSTYRILTVNYATAVVVAFDMLEQYEAAKKMDALDAPEDPALPAGKAAKAGK